MPRSLAVLAVVLLPLGGCTVTPAQADPALEANVAQATQVIPAEFQLSPADNASNGASTVSALDLEDGAVLTVGNQNGTVIPASQPAVPDIGADAARIALDVVGTPYVWGGNTPVGFDCSGLVQYSYYIAGLDLPRVAVKQRAASRAVSRKQIQPGDLLFFHIDGKRYSHLGIYVGDGLFVHAPRTGKFVSTASLDNPYWQRNFGGARRPVSDYRPVDRVSALARVRTEQ